MSCGPWGVNLAGWELRCGLWSQVQIGTLMVEIVGSWELLQEAAGQASIFWEMRKQAGLETQHPESSSGPPPLRSGRQQCGSAGVLREKSS